MVEEDKFKGGGMVTENEVAAGPHLVHEYHENSSLPRTSDSIPALWGSFVVAASELAVQYGPDQLLERKVGGSFC